MNIYIYPQGVPVLVAAVSRSVCVILYEKKKKEEEDGLGHCLFWA